MTTESVTLCHECGQPVEVGDTVRAEGRFYHTRCAMALVEDDPSEGEPPYYPFEGLPGECPGCGAVGDEGHDVVCPEVNEREVI